MKNRLVCAFLLVLLASQASGAQSNDPLHLLQMLGAQIKTASEHAKAGKQPESKALADFDRALHRLRDAAAADPHLQRKYQAIAMLFGNVQHQAAHPSLRKPDKLTRAQLDIEVVTDYHGATCASALGISEKLPVSLTLGQAGAARSDAWFRFESGKSGSVRFTTDSTGPDPALEVFTGCGAGAVKVASNDDVLGLDAAVSVSKATGHALYIHLTNSGQGGHVMVSMVDATSTVSGFVKDQNTGFTIANASVQLLDSYGNFTGYSAYTDAGGNYSINFDSPGDYFVRVDGPYPPSYVPKLYPSATCFPGSYGTNTCDLSQAQAVPVASGAAVSGINFLLSPGYRISGQVRDDANQPLSSASVQLFDGNGTSLDYAQTDGFGRYSMDTLPSGSYKIVAQASGYGSVMFNHVACGGALQTNCDLGQASLLSVSQDVTGIDFALPLQAAIEGTVTGTGSQALQNATVTVLDANGAQVAWIWTDATGHYTVGPLALGNYRLQAASNGYFSQLFDAIDCSTDCAQELPSATQVSITTQGQRAEADFHLNALPTVSGHVKDAVTSQPLANVSISVSSSAPGGGGFWWPTTSAITDSAGNYTLTSTPPGHYYVWATSDDHVDQLYSGVTCEGFQANYSLVVTDCDAGNATLLTIALGQTPGNFDFALDPASSISGRALTRAEPGFELPANTSISVYDSAGTEVAEATTDANGNYVVTDLPQETYFAEAQGPGYWWNPVYLAQLWQQIDCPTNCDPTTGTPIPLAGGATASGVDFNLVQLNGVVGRVTNTLGDPISGTVIDLFYSTDGSYQQSAITDTDGYYVVQGNLDSSYYVATEAGQDYVDQIYAGISCPLGPAYFGDCPFTNATAVTLYSNATEPTIVDFVLQSNDPIFANGFE